jgi:hypothetical protein
MKNPRKRFARIIRPKIREQVSGVSFEGIGNSQLPNRLSVRGKKGCSLEQESGCPTFGAFLFLRLRWDISIYSFLQFFTAKGGKALP